VLTPGYVGTAGHKLFAQQEFNPGNAKLCLQIRVLLGPAVGCGPGGADNIYPDPTTGGHFYGTRPYSVTSGRYLSEGELDFGTQSYEATLGNSLYNSFQVTVNKTAGPLHFLGAYTWSKALDDASGFFDMVNPFNPKISRSLSTFDVTDNFVMSYSCELPSHRLTSRSSGVVHKMLSGWQLSGITRFSTGLPVTLLESGDHALCDCEGGGQNSIDFPNYRGGAIHYLNPRSSSTLQYFTTDQFAPEEGVDPANPVLGVPGNANRRFFHGPGLNNWDVSLYKRTRITERVSLDIRAEFFNLFNHAQFNGPAGDFAGANFGQIGSVRDPRIGQVATTIHF
jgi:hypothetical protein